MSTFYEMLIFCSVFQNVLPRLTRQSFDIDYYLNNDSIRCQEIIDGSESVCEVTVLIDPSMRIFKLAKLVDCTEVRTVNK